ncbi:unnamed protein product [Orchesella dallaii]|uniref:Gustatory receptor n=1 Tax=Orchesella dallaii TaxID=48710 RepID=A0ABP1R2S2_9HEXA
MDSSHNSTLDSKNYEKLIRSSLRKVLSFPVSVSQPIGAFIFSLDSNAELTFSWFSWPILFFFLKLAYGVFSFTLFFHNQTYYLAMFGDWGDVDRFTNFMTFAVSEFSCVFSVFMIIKGRNSIQSFHNGIVQFIVDVLVENENENVIKEHLNIFEKSRKQIATPVYIIIAISCVTYFTFLSSSMFSIIKLVKADLFIVATVPFLMLSMTFLSIMRFINYLILDATIAFIWIGLRAWRSQCENITTGCHETEKMLKILRNYKRIAELIKDFNSVYQWWLLSGMLTMLANVLCYFFQLGSWIGVAGFAVLFVLAPGFVACGLSLYYFCLAASNVNEEGKLCGLMLRNIGSCTSYDKDLNEKVTSSYKIRNGIYE